MLPDAEMKRIDALMSHLLFDDDDNFEPHDPHSPSECKKLAAMLGITVEQLAQYHRQKEILAEEATLDLLDDDIGSR